MERVSAVPPPITPDELRVVTLLADLDDDEAGWVAARCELRALAAGEVLFRTGEAVEWMYLTLAGALEAVRDDHGAGGPAFAWRAGDVAGMIPFSRMQVAPSTGRALTPSRIACFPKGAFPELLARVPRLEPRFVAHLADRVRESTRRDQQQEKLGALGRLAAGLAHELNNPASAAQRFANELAAALLALDEAAAALAVAGASVDDTAALREARRRLRARPTPDGADGGDEDALARSDREEALTDWLARAGVADPWATAGPLADAGLAPADLDAVAAGFAPAVRAAAALWLATALVADGLVAGIADACGRITALVTSVKRYTHMDRSAGDEDVDLRAGIESTLALFAHRMRDRGVQLVRDFAPSLPRVRGRPGELNQVWTNLIDNAIDAAASRVTLRTALDAGMVLIEVGDDGPGVPAALQDRIWEPFFTTKAVGRGTGLGLDIARRLVEQHGGRLELRSAPGDTRFAVRLPVAAPPIAASTADSFAAPAGA